MRRQSLTDDRIAIHVGFVIKVDEVVPHSRRYVEQVAEKCSPTSISIMKRQIYEQLHNGLGPAESESQRLMIESFGRPDFKEGVQSFLQKRSPKFDRLGG